MQKVINLATDYKSGLPWYTKLQQLIHEGNTIVSVCPVKSIRQRGYTDNKYMAIEVCVVYLEPQH